MQSLSCPWHSHLLPRTSLLLCFYGRFPTTSSWEDIPQDHVFPSWEQWHKWLSNSSVGCGVWGGGGRGRWKKRFWMWMQFPIWKQITNSELSNSIHNSKLTFLEYSTQTLPFVGRRAGKAWVLWNPPNANENDKITLELECVLMQCGSCHRITQEYNFCHTPCLIPHKKGGKWSLLRSWVCTKFIW